MQIYTRTGDKGNTKIIGGQEVRKDSKRVNAYGVVDELNSLVGVTASLDKVWPDLYEELIQIQHFLFDCGNDLATPHGNEKYPYRVNIDMTKWLEDKIDKYTAIPPNVESFILPGGTQLAAYLHNCRTVTRRIERNVVAFANEEQTNEYVLAFINRLSDYFFVTARVANAKEDVEDVLYERSGKVFHLEISKDDLEDLDE